MGQGLHDVGLYVNIIFSRIYVVLLIVIDNQFFKPSGQNSKEERSQAEGTVHFQLISVPL